MNKEIFFNPISRWSKSWFGERTATFKHYMTEHEESYTIEIFLAGYSKENLEIKATARTLKVLASSETVEDGVIFNHVFNFTEAIEVDAIVANFYDGYIDIFVPKADQPKRIEVRTDEIPFYDNLINGVWV